MPNSKNPHTQRNILGGVFGYIPAVLKEYSAGWRIEYYVKNPITGELVRRQEKVQNYVNRLGKREAKAYLRMAVNNINIKLAGGWSPFFVQEDTRLYEPLSLVVEKFQKEKDKELRANTMRSYRSATHEMLQFAKANYPNITAATFNRNIAVRFMDTLLEKKRYSPTHFNNMRKLMSTFFNWCVEKCYAKENPFEKIKPKPKEKKKRILVTPEVRNKIIKELEQEGNIGTQIMVNLVYQSLIRPKEIAEVQLKDIDLNAKFIRVRAEVAKNHNERKATLSNSTIQLIKQLKIETYPTHFYLLGGQATNRHNKEHLRPNKEKAAPRRYQNE